MEDYEVYYRKQKADSNCGFAEEFEVEPRLQHQLAIFNQHLTFAVFYFFILLFFFLVFLQFSKDLKPVGTDQPKTVASVLENKPKNRYNNVLPCELREPLAAPRQQHLLIHRLPCCVTSFSLHQPSLSPQMILRE